jgi:hypothetical protein
MPVIINEFETVAEPPKPTESSKHHSAANGASKPRLVAVAAFGENVRHQVERFERVRAH